MSDNEKDQSVDDELYKFKKTVSLQRPYEIYLETEKTYQLYKKQGEKNMDPMEIVARKIRREETLYLKDLKYWVGYNFLVFSPEDQQKVKDLNERQQWFWRRMSILIPPVWYGFFAIFRYQYKFGVVKNFFASTGMIGILVKIGLSSSERDMKSKYKELYEQYRDEVLSPKYRGLKLYGGKKAYQIDDKEFTTSNFDDLKRILFNQKSK